MGGGGRIWVCICLAGRGCVRGRLGGGDGGWGGGWWWVGVRGDYLRVCDPPRRNRRAKQTRRITNRGFPGDPTRDFAPGRRDAR